MRMGGGMDGEGVRGTEGEGTALGVEVEGQCRGILVELGEGGVRPGCNWNAQLLPCTMVNQLDETIEQSGGREGFDVRGIQWEKLWGERGARLWAEPGAFRTYSYYRRVGKQGKQQTATVY